MELVLALVFLTGILIFLGGYSLVSDLLSDRTRMKERVSQEFGLGLGAAETAAKTKLFRDLDQFSSDMFSGEIVKPGWRALGHAGAIGADVSFQQLMVFGVVSAIVCGSGATLLRGWLVDIAVAMIGYFLPVIYVRSKWKARQNKLRDQLPDAFELMARVIRAGQTMPQAVMAAAQEYEPPLAKEFELCYEQQNLGLSFEAAMRELAHRTGLLEIKILVMALLVQQETGGNLAKILDNLSEVVRSRIQVRDKVKVLTAEGRMQAIVLLSLPFAALAIMYIFNRDYAMILLNSPNLLSAMLVSMLLGALWIRKIITLDA